MELGLPESDREHQLSAAENLARSLEASKQVYPNGQHRTSIIHRRTDRIQGG